MEIQQDPLGLLSIEKWLDALIPSRCAACDAISNLRCICALCEETICPPDFDSQSQIISLYAYRGAIKQIIIESKFARNEKKARALISYWSKQMSQENLLDKLEYRNFDLISFVPIHWRRRLWRGFDLSSIFAKSVSQKLKLPLCDLLLSVRLEKPLTLAHGKQEREQMTKDRFLIKKTISPKNILLIDDVTTTGATLDSASQILKKAGHHVIALTLAKTPAKM